MLTRRRYVSTCSRRDPAREGSGVAQWPTGEGRAVPCLGSAMGCEGQRQPKFGIESLCQGYAGTRHGAPACSWPVPANVNHALVEARPPVNVEKKKKSKTTTIAYCSAPSLLCDCTSCTSCIAKRAATNPYCDGFFFFLKSYTCSKFTLYTWWNVWLCSGNCTTMLQYFQQFSSLPSTIDFGKFNFDWEKTHPQP